MQIIKQASPLCLFVFICTVRAFVPGFTTYLSSSGSYDPTLFLNIIEDATELLLYVRYVYKYLPH